LNGRRNKRFKLSEQVFFVQPISRLLLFFNCGATTIRSLFHEVRRKYPLPSRLKSQRLVASVFPQYSFCRSIPSAAVFLLPQSFRCSLTAAILPQQSYRFSPAGTAAVHPLQAYCRCSTVPNPQPPHTQLCHLLPSTNYPRKNRKARSTDPSSSIYASRSGARKPSHTVCTASSPGYPTFAHI
jgi:hypothetical protein